MANPVYEGEKRPRHIFMVPNWVSERPAYFLARRFNSAYNAEKQKRREAEDEIERLRIEARTLGREALAARFREWIHEQPFSECDAGSDTCPDWKLAYELADLARRR